MAARQGMLTKEQVDAFMDRWLNDPLFARQLRTDPKAALTSCGIQPSADLVDALKGVQSSTPAEELRRRVSRGKSLQ